MSYSEDYVPPGEDPYITVRHFSSLVDLDRALMSLAAMEIDARSADDHTLQSDPLLTNAIGGARLMVRQSQAAEARAALDDLFGAPEEGAAEDLTRRIRQRMLTGAPLALLFAAIIGVIKGNAFVALVTFVLSVGALFIMALLTVDVREKKISDE